MKVYLETLGCKLNESELEVWTRRFDADGHEIVASAREADVCVLNTCTVTHVAARKSRQIARQLARANPDARIVLTGCYATMAPAEARTLPNVAVVVSNRDKDRLVERIADNILPIAGCAQSAIRSTPSALSHSRTRAFVKTQDGCNMSCTYCIIPLARGKERSRPLRDVVAEVKGLVNAGYQEIILTGVQISAYRAENPVFSERTGFSSLRDLVAAILAETALPRLRLTSIAPWDFDANLLELWSDPRLCRHLHFSLQSGSDSVLRRMRRPYTTAQFSRAVELARTVSPEVGITTDMIVGFPGETDAEFAESLHFVESVGFSRVHVFGYSAREGTPAATMPQVPERVKESRAKAMRQVADAAMRAFAARFVGKTLRVLWESEEKRGEMKEERGEGRHASSPVARHSPFLWSGYTDNYIRVSTMSDLPLHNRITHVLLTGGSEDGGYGIVQ